MSQVILITGASSGIGFDAAKAFARLGYRVYAAARRIELMEPLRSEGIVPIKLDVTDLHSMQECVQKVVDAEGGIDILVNNAGYGYFGAIENVPIEEARRQLEVNVFGLAQMCRLVLPEMRRQGRGRIINISSVAGKMVMPFGGWYHVSKFSVEALSDALRIEVKPFGISVVMIEPGGIFTDWGVIAARHLEESSAGTPYESMASREAMLMKKAYTEPRWLSSPSVVTRAIVRAASCRCPKARYRIGRFAHTGVFFHWLLPAKWWDGIMRFLLKS